MKVTLRVNGREMTFSEVENIIIDEEKISSETTKQEEATQALKTEVKKVPKTYEVADTPTEGKCFKVSYEEINKSLFSEPRSDRRQENTRQLILKAFEEVEKNPDKYADSFETYMPKKDWDVKTVEELEKEATKLGDYNGDWVEQALEWAQRINNGESWEDVCNRPDTANWYRLVKWKNGYWRLAGGSRKNSIYNPATDVSNGIYSSNGRLNITVPFVVLRRKK